MKEEKQPIAFFCRAKPQGADAFDIFKIANRVFIGYPFWKEKMLEDNYPEKLEMCMINPTQITDEEEWEGLKNSNNYVPQFTQNRNFIENVTKGSIVVIPRPEFGEVHIARIKSEFHIVNSPCWREKYLELRLDQGLHKKEMKEHQYNRSVVKSVVDRENCLAGDVAQGWKVDEYKSVNLAFIPGWIRHSLFGRSTYGQVRETHPLDSELTSHEILTKIYCGTRPSEYKWSCDLEEIKRRLVDSSLNSHSLEVLVVSLLQLDNPKEFWHHTGGAGDGGIDGFASDQNGNTVGVMQAKYHEYCYPKFSENKIDSGIRRYAAVFLSMDINSEPLVDNTTYIDLDWIAERVKHYWKFLPIALSLRIGSPEYWGNLVR